MCFLQYLKLFTNFGKRFQVHFLILHAGYCFTKVQPNNQGLLYNVYISQPLKIFKITLQMNSSTDRQADTHAMSCFQNMLWHELLDYFI